MTELQHLLLLLMVNSLQINNALTIAILTIKWVISDFVIHERGSSVPLSLWGSWWQAGRCGSGIGFPSRIIKILKE